MTDKEMNAAIAEACGTLKDGTRPQYTADLNAMHEAEALKASDMLWCQNYQEKLRYACDASGFDWETCFIWHATARQRAEAFLRTLGLFTE